LDNQDKQVLQLKGNKMVTVVEVKKAVDQAFKPLSKRQVLRYIYKAGVKAIGKRSRPRMFPDDTTQKVLLHLQVKIPTMAELRSARSRALKSQHRRAA
jgi:hypothetical protein